MPRVGQAATMAAAAASRAAVYTAEKNERNVAAAETKARESVLR